MDLLRKYNHWKDRNQVFDIEMGSNVTKLTETLHRIKEAKNKVEELEMNIASKTTDEITNISSDIKSLLAGFSAVNGVDEQERRMINMQAVSLGKRFMSVINQHTVSEIKSKNNIKDTVKRQYLIVNPDASEKELNELKPQQLVFQEQMNQSLRKAIVNIQSRHQQILDIEKSVLELNGLFLDMSVLIEEQGVVIDRIDEHVGTGLDRLNEGEKEVVKAIVKQRKKRKRMMWCSAFFVVGIVVVVVVLVA